MSVSNVQICIFQSCLNKVPTQATYLEPSLSPYKRKQWTFASIVRYGTCHYRQELYLMACTVPNLYLNFFSPKTPMILPRDYPHKPPDDRPSLCLYSSPFSRNLYLLQVGRSVEPWPMDSSWLCPTTYSKPQEDETETEICWLCPGLWKPKAKLSQACKESEYE